MLTKYNFRTLLLISLISSLFIIYPNITWLPYELSYLNKSKHSAHLLFFFFRYFCYAAVIFLLMRINLKKIKTSVFKKRFFDNLKVSAAAYLLFGAIGFLLYGKLTHFGSLVLFQFLIICVLATLMGHIVYLYKEQRQQEQEIEQLKVKNLQSRYDALMNQINPHFFFNSLNGLTSLIRKKNNDVTLAYVNKLSDVFRYILQSDKKGIVTLGEELAFVNAFRYMMEVRFANKLEYKIEVDPELLSSKLPVLSILPLLDNVVVHNMIDSDHKMTVTIRLNEEKELVVSNPVYPKIAPPQTNGTGLINLANRFSLLMNKQIRMENNGHTFSVFLPLI